MFILFMVTLPVRSLVRHGGGTVRLRSTRLHGDWLAADILRERRSGSRGHGGMGPPGCRLARQAPPRLATRAPLHRGKH